MKIKRKEVGSYLTNCYIVQKEGKEIIIDPGIDALKWVLESVKNPLAILNTHGHFDHVWSNEALKKELNIPIYIPKDDEFMLSNDIFGTGNPPSKADVLVDGDEKFNLDGFEFEFLHFAGHTPGCSAIVIDDVMFSGDFIFSGSIGRTDFPYCSVDDMKKSIQKVLKIKKNYKLYTGHGNSSYLDDEKESLKSWLTML